MASINGLIVVVKMGKKYLGKGGTIVNDIHDALLIDALRNGRFTGADDTLKKFNIDPEQFKKVTYVELAPSFDEMRYYAHEYPGHFENINYSTIRDLAYCRHTLREYIDAKNNHTEL